MAKDQNQYASGMILCSFKLKNQSQNGPSCVPPFGAEKSRGNHDLRIK